MFARVSVVALAREKRLQQAGRASPSLKTSHTVSFARHFMRNVPFPDRHGQVEAMPSLYNRVCFSSSAMDGRHLQVKVMNQVRDGFGWPASSPFSEISCFSCSLNSFGLLGCVVGDVYLLTWSVSAERQREWRAAISYVLTPLVLSRACPTLFRQQDDEIVYICAL